MDKIIYDLQRATSSAPTALSYLRAFFTDPGFKAVVYYRLANFFARKGVRYLPRIIACRATGKTASDISPFAEIGPGLVIKHSVGIVIGCGVKIGANCTLLQSVTLGEKYSRDGSHNYPVIGDNVTICAGAVILGSVSIGNHSTIGANSLVLNDVEPNAIVAGSPARLLNSTTWSKYAHKE